jgi:BlaI family penicillinase repressor
MPAIPRISETEWEVMKVVWADAPLTANDVLARLTAQDPSWHPKTARTLLNRLVKKKALGFHREGRAYLYRPLVAERDCVAAATNSFLDRVFGGALEPMLAHFVEHRKLSDTELRELQRILQRKA